MRGQPSTMMMWNPFMDVGDKRAMLNMLPDQCAESMSRCHLRPERHRRGAIVDGDERGCPLPTEEEAVLPNPRRPQQRNRRQ
jgi:hypothetical protein